MVSVFQGGATLIGGWPMAKMASTSWYWGHQCLHSRGHPRGL